MAYDDNNVFTRILRGELPSDKVYEDECALAFRDLYPQAPIHVLVIPKARFVSFDDFVAGADAELQVGFFHAIRHTAHQLGLAAGGYRLIANHNRDARQEVPHFHVHILGGRDLKGLLPAA